MVPVRLLRPLAHLTPAALVIVALLAAPAGAPAADTPSGLHGTWVTPDKSAVTVFSCGADLCIKIARVAPSEPYTVDGLNPDPALKTRPLCGLVIGKSFQAKDASHAEDGELYDPKSGKTYHGSMAADGDTMRLRGYIGVKLFGRSETWTRATTPVEGCKASK